MFGHNYLSPSDEVTLTRIRSTGTSWCVWLNVLSSSRTGQRCRWHRAILCSLGWPRQPS